MNGLNGAGPQVGACDPVENVGASSLDNAHRNAQLSPEEVRAAMRTIANVARHYVTRLQWAVAPSYHQNGACGKSTSVKWANAARSAEQVEDLFMARGMADICVLTKPSQMTVFDCDRSVKTRLVGGEAKKVFVDGFRNLLDFTGGDLGAPLISLTKRGIHLLYAADTDEAARIKTQAGPLLDGVDVRGGNASGGISIEPNGVCTPRRWVTGTPRIDAAGNITGVTDLGPIVFDEEGNCFSGLPMPDADGWPIDMGTLPPLMLDMALFTSGVLGADEADERVLIAAKRRLRAPRHASSVTLPTGTPSDRPYKLTAECACGECDRFEEAKVLLSYVPAEVGRDTWRRAILGVADMVNGSACGERLVAEWSGCSRVPDRRDPADAAVQYVGDRRRGVSRG